MQTIRRLGSGFLSAVAVKESPGGRVAISTPENVVQ